MMTLFSSLNWNFLFYKQTIFSLHLNKKCWKYFSINKCSFSAHLLPTVSVEQLFPTHKRSSISHLWQNHISSQAKYRLHSEWITSHQVNHIHCIACCTEVQVFNLAQCAHLSWEKATAVKLGMQSAVSFDGVCICARVCATNSATLLWRVCCNGVRKQYKCNSKVLQQWK